MRDLVVETDENHGARNAIGRVQGANGSWPAQRAAIGNGGGRAGIRLDIRPDALERKAAEAERGATGMEG